MSKAAVVAVNPHLHSPNSAMEDVLKAAEHAPMIIVYTDKHAFDIKNDYTWKSAKIGSGAYEVETKTELTTKIGEDITKLLRAEGIDSVIVAGDYPGGLKSIVSQITAVGTDRKIYTMSAHKLIANAQYPNLIDEWNGKVHVRVDHQELLPYVA